MTSSEGVWARSVGMGEEHVFGGVGVGARVEGNTSTALPIFTFLSATNLFNTLNRKPRGWCSVARDDMTISQHLQAGIHTRLRRCDWVVVLIITCRREG